jgi:hypothetical protein
LKLGEAMKLRDPFYKISTSLMQDTIAENMPNGLQRTASASSNKDKEGKESRQQESRRERAARQQH